MRFNIFIIICSFIMSLSSAGSLAADTRNNEPEKTEELFYSSKGKPIFYSRANIALIRKAPPPLPRKIVKDLPWQDDSSKKDLKPIATSYPRLIFDVEIRGGAILYNQQGWFNLSNYSEKNGVMMAFNEVGKHPIIHSKQYVPVDILFINKQGLITQIAPSILLSELDENIYPKSPILAFLFLKGGICNELSINVGDEIQYSLFKKPPLILDAPVDRSGQEDFINRRPLIKNME